MANDTIYFALSFIKTLSAKKVFNSFLLRLSYFLSKLTKKTIHWGTFESLSIEPINQCNLHCPECDIGSKKIQRKSPKLSEINFKKVIDETHKTLVYLQLYFQGEPFINSNIYTFIRYATLKKVFTSTSTNGHFLSQENSEKIVASGLNQVIISIDGTTQNIFEKYRKGGNLKTVIQGIKNLNNAKKNAKSKHPHIAIQFVVLKHNEHQIYDFIKLGKQLSINDIRLKTAQINNPNKAKNLIPTNTKYSRYKKDKQGNLKIKRKKKFKCFRVWSGAVISSDMNLLPCCFDKSGNYKFGNVTNNNPSKIWKNNIALNFRKQVWKKKNKISMCNNCSEGLKNKILLKK